VPIPDGVSRKSLILTSIFLGVLCAVMALIPTALDALARATGKPAPSLDPRRAAADLLGTDADAPPTLAEWIRDRTDDDPTQLKLVGTPDPGMGVEERIALLEEAEENQPEVPKQPAPGEKPRRGKAPRQPPEVLPADQPDPE
jgi:hypothetical protein